MSIVVHDDDDQRHPGEPPLLEAQAVVEDLADAADAEDAEHRRHADVDLEAVEHERGDLRHRLGDHGPAQPLQLRRPDRVGRLDRPAVDTFDDLRESLPSVPTEPMAIAMIPGALGQAEHRDQGEDEDQLGDRRAAR